MADQYAVSNMIRYVAWTIPPPQTVHTVCIALLIASAAMLDLRLFSIAGQSDSVTVTAKRLLPWIGSPCLFCFWPERSSVAEPSRELENSTFVEKMILIVVIIVVTGGSSSLSSATRPSWTPHLARRDGSRCWR